MKKALLCSLAIVVTIGCVTRENVARQQPTIESLYEAIEGDILCSYPLYSTKLFAVFFKANYDGIPRALVTYPVYMNEHGGHCWFAYYFKDGRWRSGSARYDYAARMDDFNNYIDGVGLRGFYILTEEGQEPKFIAIDEDGYKDHDYVEKTDFYVAWRKLYYITINPEGYLKTMLIPELSFEKTRFNMEDENVENYPKFELKSPNDKLEPVSYQMFGPGDFWPAGSVDFDENEVRAVGSPLWVLRNVTVDTPVISETTYVVPKTTDIYDVSLKVSVPSRVLRKFNNLTSSELNAGQVLRIPEYAPLPTAEKKGN